MRFILAYCLYSLVFFLPLCCYVKEIPPAVNSPEQERYQMRKELQRAIDSVNGDTCQPQPQCVERKPPGAPR